MSGQGREASTDRKEFVDKDVLMITEQLRAKANPLTPTASRKSRDLLKELTKSKKKKVPSGLPPQTQARSHPLETAGAITTDSVHTDDGREIKISPRIKPNTQGNSPPNPLLSDALLLPFAISSLVSGKFQSHHQPTLPNAQWHLIIAYGSRLGSQASTHNSLHV